MVLEGRPGIEIDTGKILGVDVLGWLVGGFGGDHLAGHRRVELVARLGIVLVDAELRVGLYLHLEVGGEIVLLLGIPAKFLGLVFWDFGVGLWVEIFVDG